MEFILFRIIFGIKIKAINNQFKAGKKPVIFIANHQSHLDTPSILFSLPAPLRYKTVVAAADDYFFNNQKIFLRIMAFMLNLFPFYRKNNFKSNFDNIGKLLDNNYSIVIYPEGTRSRDGKMASFKNGIGMIVREMNVPVVPVKIKNSFGLLPYNKKMPRRGNVYVTFGKEINFCSQKPEEITGILEKTIKEIGS